MNPSAAEAAEGIVPAKPQTMVRAAPGDVTEAFREYQKIQQGLDRAMGPDCIMRIGGKQFRKKSYWRAIATAFNLDVIVQDERREVYGVDDVLAPGGQDWGYVVTYRATAPNGRSCTGDGSCFASEKKAAVQRTVHNVRSHAHTRAYNRAVSNLVGFGEVSAEEINDREVQEPGAHDGPEPQPEQQSAHGQNKITAVVKEVRQKRGQGPSGPWTLYRLILNDGLELSTFDKKQAQFAKDAGSSPVTIVWDQTEKGRNVLSIDPA